MKRESLAILATLGTAKDFIGMDMTLGDVKRLSVKDVEKSYVRYQAVLGKCVTGDLTDTVIEVTSKATSYVLPIDDVDDLSKDLKNNDVVTRDLSTFAGYLALNGRRFVALATALFIITKHVKLEDSQKKPNTPQDSTKKPEEPLEPLVMTIE